MAGWSDIVAGFVSGLGDTAVKIRTAITGIDATKQAELAALAANLEAQAKKAETDLLAGQLEVNKAEASSINIFVAGARPAILWVGALVMLYTYILAPLLKSFGLALPELALNELWPIITGILGLGGMRTYEKVKGAASNH
jgi:hypothetical protein